MLEDQAFERALNLVVAGARLDLEYAVVVGVEVDFVRLRHRDQFTPENSRAR